MSELECAAPRPTARLLRESVRHKGIIETETTLVVGPRPEMFGLRFRIRAIVPLALLTK